MGKLIILAACILSCLTGFSQYERKSCSAVRVNAPLKIDGNLNEEAWKTATSVTGFIELRPVNQRKEKYDQRTEVKVLYDDAAIYIGAVMHDVSADSIAKEIAQRDRIGNADFFMVFIDTYNTGINGNGFAVTTANSQYDARYSNENNGEDDTWNAVWESAVKLEGNVWMVEMRIPYSALRFAKKDVQQWGINFMRRRNVAQQQLFWSPIDPVKTGFVNQWGLITDMRDIKPPLRLSFTPYFSTYVDHYPYNTPGIKNTTISENGGMDVKYGINESFTLDMTLIPDFGQVQFDNKILNLTPFEVKYNENRPFFTEGTELFTKGNLFYSRRIGGPPIYHDSIQYNLTTGETVVSNPTEAKLINATKISGRTKSGLGIGVLNALTENMYAVVEDDQGKRRNIRTQPLTNYNIVVLDQSLKNNSSVTLINTNVTREGRDYDANVTSGLFNLFTKHNKYNLSGQVAVSQITGLPGGNRTGYNYSISGGKSSGRFNAIFTHSVLDDKYDPNDMDILNNNNEIDDNLNLNYSFIKAGKWYNSIYMGAYGLYSQRFLPRTYQNFDMGYYFSVNFKNLWNINTNGDFNPFANNDFYEPRTTGRFYRAPAAWAINLNINSNQAKKYSIYLGLSYRKRYLTDGYGMDFTYDQNYRFSNKFSLEHTITISPRRSLVGYANSYSADSVFFGRRNVNTVEDILSGKYSFSSAMGITLRARHYISSVNYKQYFLLNTEGKLDKTTYNDNNDIDLNLFNVDLVYTWWFAPGSEVSIAWKNSIQTSEDQMINGYFTNLSHTVNSPQDNNFSVKILYYIDYLSLHKHRK